MQAFTDAELAYLRSERRLARLATVGADGTPHVTPVGWKLAANDSVVEVGGMDLTRTKKFRDVLRTGRAALVIDDLASVNPWHVRNVEIRGRAEAVAKPDPPVIRIHPERIVSWGI
ncbi:MAG: PPOX class F420-dependent oxidoreductase [Geodermatophilaceae bacterium]|nr:PPOX class F420-dependent oxidoreductase [Geodermatophilaceae bacterium]